MQRGCSQVASEYSLALELPLLLPRPTPGGAMLPGSKLRVLVVDDDASMARFLSAHLTRRNFEVNTAASGEEAIRMFRIFDPNLVLLDVEIGRASCRERV